MENHPIPQDVTGFQFRLIGDMTVKQFAYLAAGSVLAWLFFILPITIFVKFPLVVLFFSTGAALAFLPIAGRPMDLMLYHFLKDVFTPSEYIFQKQGGHVAIFDYHYKPAKHKAKVQPARREVKLESLLGKRPLEPKNELDRKELVFFESLSSLFSNQPLTSPSLPSSLAPHIVSIEGLGPLPQPTIKELGSEQEDEEQDLRGVEKEAQLIKQELEAAKQQETEISQRGKNPKDTHLKVVELEKQLNEVLLQKQQLEAQFAKLQKQLSNQKQNVFIPTVAQIKKETPNVRKIPKSVGPTVGLPITSEFPNLITGIVKDSRGNVLPNILVEIKDKEQNPVRAFKTNTLGQFASATPLLNGTYTVEFEDPKGVHAFDTVELSATGDIIMPIEVLSIDAREKLRRDLFGITH